MTETFEAESIRITTSRPGHPLLVKVSYHPRWRAEGAFGPYLASPGFMLVVPRQREVRLTYAARTWSDYAGLGLAVLAVALAAPRPGVAAPAGRTSASPPGRRRRPRAGGRPSRPCCPSRSSSGWPRCASFPSPARRRVRRLDERPPGPSPRSGGRTPPSTLATRPRSFRRPTRGGPSCSASAARRCSAPVIRAKRSSRSRSSSRASRGRTGRRRCTRVPSRARRRETRRALRPGAASSARSTPRRRGRAVSSHRPARPRARDGLTAVSSVMLHSPRARETASFAPPMEFDTSPSAAPRLRATRPS